VAVFVDDETLLGPVVLLGPSDVVLCKPVVVSFEHCAAVRQGRWTLSVLADTQTLLGPVVLLGPSDVVLHKPVVVSFEHCAAVRQGRWTLSVLADTQTYSHDDDDLPLTHRRMWSYTSQSSSVSSTVLPSDKVDGR